MDYYDIAFDSCNVNKDLESELGFKKIFTNKDIGILEGDYKSGIIRGSLFIDNGNGDVLSVINSNPAAVSFADLNINKDALSLMEEMDIILCMPLSIATSSYGFSRSKNLFLMKKLFRHAKKLNLRISFATLAKKESELCSSLQLIEIAKLIGADENYARESVSKTNKFVLK